MTILRTLFVTIAAMLLIVPTAQADLSQYSTEVLMEEVGRRIDALSTSTPGGGGGNYSLSLTCDSWNVLAKLLGPTAPIEVTLSTTKCNEQIATLRQKYEGNFSGHRVMYYCTNQSKMVTVQITPTAIREIGDAERYDSDEMCIQALKTR